MMEVRFFVKDRILDLKVQEIPRIGDLVVFETSPHLYKVTKVIHKLGPEGSTQHDIAIEVDYEYST